METKRDLESIQLFKNYVEAWKRKLAHYEDMVDFYTNYAPSEDDRKWYEDMRDMAKKNLEVDTSILRRYEGKEGIAERVVEQINNNIDLTKKVY